MGFGNLIGESFIANMLACLFLTFKSCYGTLVYIMGTIYIFVNAMELVIWCVWSSSFSHGKIIMNRKKLISIDRSFRFY